MQSPIAISVLLVSISPPLSGHLLSLPIFHLPFCLHDQPMYSPPISSVRCFSVSAIVSSAFMNAGLTHELSIFPLCLRDMPLSPTTPSTFLQAFFPVVILILLKQLIYWILHWGNDISYREFINCNTQRYML